MCLVAAGNQEAANCNIKSGVKPHNIWWGNKSDITLTISNGTATALSMAADTALFRLEMNKTGNNISHTFVPNDFGGGDYTHLGDLRSVENKAALKKLIETAIGAKIVLFEQGQDGVFLVAGYDVGLSLNKDDFSLDKAALGHTWQLQSLEEPHPLLHMLITDEAGTLAALVAAETP